jgi:hypothetical protein
MRAIGLVLLSIMALLLTDADAQRRSSAQGEPGGGGQRKLVRDLSQSGPQTTTAAIPRSTSAIKRRSWAAAAFADPIRFRVRHTGPATLGQVRSARAKSKLGGEMPKASARRAAFTAWTTSPLLGWECGGKHSAT